MKYTSSTYIDLTDEALIRLVQDGDEEAFAQLAARHSSRIWHMVVLNARQIRDAEEIFQDIWLAVWRHISGLREISSFEAWLRKIAYTTCRRYYAAAPQKGGEILQSAEQLAEIIDRDGLERFRETELRTAVTEAVYDLPEPLRGIAVLYYLEMWTIREIAAEHNVPVGTIKTRLRDIRARLRQEFGIKDADIKKGKITMQEKERTESAPQTLKIIGVGAAGGTSVRQMIAIGLEGVEFYAVDTDTAALRTCEGAIPVQIRADETTQDTGNLETLKAVTANAKLVFVTAGMGGSAGTGASPVIAALAREQGALAIGVVTLPFDFEGQAYSDQARNGIQALREATDALIVIPNQRILDTLDTEPTRSEAFRISTETVLHAVECILELAVQPEGQIHVDFTDVQGILKDAGRVFMCTGQASGENRAHVAMEQAIASPLLEGRTIAGATGMIIRVSAPPDFKMDELDAAMNRIQAEAPDAQIIFGMVYTDAPDPENSVNITILAAGVPNENRSASPSAAQPSNSAPKQGPATGSGFVHLHNHSEYSLLDGACRIPQIVDWAVENNAPAVALTDHGNMFGAWEFYHTAAAAGINPIIGCEVYIARTADGEQSEPYHLTLLAEDALGYRNLLALVSLGYTEGFNRNRKPCVSLDILRQHRDGVIALTGCIHGQVPQLLCTNQREAALRQFKTLIEIMGRRNLYVEVQNHYIREELQAYPLMAALAKEFDIPLVGTNDCHYLQKTDHRMHDILHCIQTRQTLNDGTRFSDGNHFYFKSTDEMRVALKDYPPEALSNTLEIAGRCNLVLDPYDTAMPKPEVPEGQTHDSYLKALCYRGLRQKYGTLSAPIRQRLDYELNIISQGGHANYFLIVADYVNYAHKQGYPLSARGSAAGSLVLYALGVISFNPMEHGCLFERFLNLERDNPPDIDIDFADAAREDVMAYLAKKYGADSVGRVVTFHRMGAKRALKDVGRALDVPTETVDTLTGLIPNAPHTTLDEVLARVPDFQTLAALPENRELIDISKAVEGMKCSVSCHTSAVVVSAGPLTNYVPLFKDRHGRVATQFDGKTVEDMGIVKFDSLGLRSLTQTYECLQMIESNRSVKIKLESIPFDDKATYALVSSGLIAGLFQLDNSPGMLEVVRTLKPYNFETFSAIPALYRPSPIENGDLKTYIDRKNGVAPVTYIHPSLEKVLDTTYGVCIYQEQLMQIAHDTAGFTLGEADILRHALGRKEETLSAIQREKFVAGAVKNGNLAKSEAETVFDWLATVGKYAFNKAHTVAYSMLAYRMAYLKTHYPQEFMKVIIAGEANDSETIARYRTEGQKLSDFLKTEIHLPPV